MATTGIIIGRGQMLKFIKLILPPLLARFAAPLLRVLLPAAAMLVLSALIIPAGFTALLVWLVTGDGNTAATAALVVMGIVAAGLVVLGAWLWQQWRVFRRKRL